jgi:hypothetical protein
MQEVFLMFYRCFLAFPRVFKGVALFALLAALQCCNPNRPERTPKPVPRRVPEPQMNLAYFLDHPSKTNPFFNF